MNVGSGTEEGSSGKLKVRCMAALRVLAGRHWIRLVLLLTGVSKSQILAVS